MPLPKHFFVSLTRAMHEAAHNSFVHNACASACANHFPFNCKYGCALCDTLHVHVHVCACAAHGGIIRSDLSVKGFPK